MGSGLIYGCLTPHPPILVPAVGGGRLEQVRRTRDALQEVAGDIHALSPDALVLISPHAPLSPRSMGVAVVKSYTGGFDAFGVPSIRLTARGDEPLAFALEEECRAFGIPQARIGRPGGVYRLDHGATVPLFFLQEAGVRCDLVLVAFSDLEVEVHRRFGRAIAAAAREAGRRVVLVASGDLSHRLFPGAPAGYSPLGHQFDETIVSALTRSECGALLELDEGLLCEAGECGYRSLVIALGALPEATVEVLSYEGPFGVGYLVARFRREDLYPAEACLPLEVAAVPDADLAAEERKAHPLARQAVETWVREDRRLEVPSASKGLLAGRAGVFVSLKMEGQLRGCIGTYLPSEPTVAEEILRNAIAAATQDPRFTPVTSEELPLLEYSIDLLSAPEPVSDPSELSVDRYGVIVRAGAKRGLLLPDLEGVATVEDQIDIARRKAGIAPGVPLHLQRFTVRRIRERS